MALKAGYVGVKRWLYEKLQSVPDKVDGLIESNNITGAKNFIPPSLNTGTFLDVVFTNNGGVLNLNGTANATNSVALTNRTTSGNYFYLPIGKYKYTAAPMKTVEVGTTYSSAYKKIASSSNGEVEFEITADTQSDYKLSDGSVLVALYIGLVNTTVYNNVKVYPMIRLASVTDDTFEPYAMTNQQLTEKVFDKGLLTSADDLNDVKDTGIYYVTTAPANSPEGASYYALLSVINNPSDGKQIVFKSGTSAGVMYIRSLGSNSTWTNWVKFTGTVVTPATQNSPAPDDDTRSIEPEIEETKTVRTTRKSTKKEVE